MDTPVHRISFAVIVKAGSSVYELTRSASESKVIITNCDVTSYTSGSRTVASKSDIYVQYIWVDSLNRAKVPAGVKPGDLTTCGTEKRHAPGYSTLQLL